MTAPADAAGETKSTAATAPEPPPGEPRRLLSGIDALRADPTVVVGPIPKEEGPQPATPASLKKTPVPNEEAASPAAKPRQRVAEATPGGHVYVQAGAYFSEAALVAAAYVLFLGFAFHGPSHWAGNQTEFGFFVDHFTFMAGLFFAVEFFWPVATSGPDAGKNFLTPYLKPFSDVTTVLQAFALGVGIYSLLNVHLLAGHGYVDGLLLLHDLFADAHLAGFDRLLVNAQLLLADGHGALLLAGAHGGHAGGTSYRIRAAGGGIVGPVAAQDRHDHRIPIATFAVSVRNLKDEG